MPSYAPYFRISKIKKKHMAQTAIIKLYGNIFEWNLNNAQAIVSQIEKGQDADLIKLRVHCYGGSVIEGNMIYNAIKNSTTPVDIYVDGIAASMASVLLVAARKVYMSENAFLMVHAPSGGVDGRGTADEHSKTARALKEMEKLFVKALVSRTGKAETEIKKWMVGDNWFSADQALSEKLIDGIVDPVASDVKTLTTEEVQTATVENIYGLYTAMYDDSETTTKPKNEMDKEKLIKELGLAGVTAASTDEEVQAAIQAKLNAEKTAKETAENALKEHAKAQVAVLLDSVKDKLTREQRTQYEAIGESIGLTALETVIAPLKGVRSFTAAIANASGDSGAISQQRAAWNFEAWQKNDPRGLEKMAREDYDGFNALYKATFGVEAPK